jgi:twinkle protein
MQKIIDQGIRLKSFSEGDHKTLCPQCSHNRRNKTDPCLSVTIKSDGGAVWKCHNCEWSGGTSGLNGSHIVPKVIRRPKKPEVRSTTDSIQGWFGKRGISSKTVEHFDIYRSEQYFGNGEAEGCVSFPYYKDGELVNIKHRTKNKRFKQEKDAERSLFNIDRVKDRWSLGGVKEVIFVEGEMDVLSLFESGFDYAISLPDGAPKEAKFDPNDKRFAALSSCEWLNDAEKVIVAVDGDDAGQALQSELIHRFGKDRCWTVEWPSLHDIDIKDANECLVEHGKEVLAEVIDNATPHPIDGLYGIKDYRQEVLSIYDGNYQKPTSTGFTELDEFYQVMPSTFCVVTGIPNHGKSNFIDQIAVNMAVNHAWKFAIFSPEHSTANHIRRLSEKVIKLPFDIGPNERMSKQQLEQAMAFLQDRFFFIEADDKIPDITWLLSRVKHACFRHGINGVIIDPYNEIDAKRDGNKREDEHIRDLISQCKQFCRSHNIAMWMVAHPAKMQRGSDGAYPPPSLYDISGSAHWNNMCDVGLVIHRDFEENNTRLIVRKIREQGLYGSIGEVFFNYNTAKHIYEPDTTAQDISHGIYQD